MNRRWSYVRSWTATGRPYGDFAPTSDNRVPRREKIGASFAFCPRFYGGSPAEGREGGYSAWNAPSASGNLSPNSGFSENWEVFMSGKSLRAGLYATAASVL